MCLLSPLLYIDILLQFHIKVNKRARGNPLALYVICLFSDYERVAGIPVVTSAEPVFSAVWKSLPVVPT